MPYILPTPEPRRRWYNDYGEAQGLTARLLLAMLSGGASGVPNLGKQPTTPTPGNPGQIQFPSGASTTTSPLEQAMMSQLGGAPTRQGTIVPQGQGGVTYQSPTRWGFQPPIAQQLQQLKLQQAQQQLNPQSPLNQFLVAQSRDMNSQADQRNRQGQPADASASSASSFYHEGDVLERSGKRYKIVGFDTDGMPLVEEE